MNYPTNLLRAFAVVCSWRILRTKIVIFCYLCKIREFSNYIINCRFLIYYLDHWKNERSSEE